MISGDDSTGGSGGGWLGSGWWWGHDVLNDWLLRSGSSGSNLSSTWSDSSDLWTHILVLQNHLILLALINAIEEETLLKKEEDCSPHGTGNNNAIPELSGLLLCSFH